MVRCMGRYVAIIPFRRGSKRIKDKNIYNLNGYPLFEYSVITAITTKNLDMIIVATDYTYDEIKNSLAYDDKRISYLPRDPVDDKQIASQYIMNVIVTYKLQNTDNIVLLQPTCPIRKPEWVDNAITLHKKKPRINILSAFKIDNGTYNKNGEHLDLLGMPCYVRNSSIYIFNVGKFIDTEYNIFRPKVIIYEMPKWASIDINYMEDIVEAEKILKGWKN